MAKPIECAEHIPIYTPEQVFEVGTLVSTLPNIDGLTLEVEDERFAPDTAVRVGLVVATHEFVLEGQVSEFRPAERVLIEGRSHIGSAAVWLNLTPDANQGGTEIEYGIHVRHNLLTKAFEPIVAQHLQVRAPLFAKHYRNNVIVGLDALHKPPRRRKAA